ncbi:MAG: Ig-like domain-containing protein, partial [Phycisphaerae bacterium]
IIFSEAVVGFGLSDVTLTRDGGGDLLTGAEWVDTADGITWTVSDLTPLTGLSGTYTVTVRAAGSDIHDAAGNLMQLDASDTWVVDTQPPTADIIDVAPDPRNSAVDAVEIVFSEPVTGFDRADLSLTRDGEANLLSGDETLETGDGATWTLSGLTHLTGAGGRYTLTLRAVGSGIRDGVGKPLVGDASDSWLTELEAPSAGAWHTAAEHANGVGEVLLEIADDGLFSEPRTSGVYRLVIEFSEPIDPASFTPTSVLMAGNDVNSQPVDLSSIVVSTSMRDGDTMGVIDFAGALPDVVRYLVQIEGVTDIAGNPVAGDNNRVFTALAGDANGDFRVNAIDLSYIWPRRTMQIDGVSVGQARSDVNCDGRINAIDLSSVWPRRGADMRDVCDPVLTGKLGGAGTSSDALATAAALAGTPGDGGGSVPAGAADAADISPVVPAMMDVPIAPSAAPDVVTVPAGTQALEVSGEPDAPDTGSDILDVLSLSKLLALPPTASR